MKQHLKYILLLLIYIGTSYQNSIAGPPVVSSPVVYTLGSSDYAESLVSDVNGNIYFLNNDNSSGNNIFTIKKLDIYDTISTIYTLTSTSINNNYFYVYNLKKDNIGNLYYLAEEYNNNNWTYSINKIDANGSISSLVTKTNAYFYDFNIDNAGNLYYILNENSNIYINKIEANGNSTNLLTSSSNSQYYFNLKIDLQGNIYFIKHDYSSNSSTNSIIKISNSGNNMVSLIISTSGTNFSRNINQYEITSSGDIKFIQQNYYSNNNQSTYSTDIKKIDSNRIVSLLYNDSVSTNSNYSYIQNSCKDNLGNLFYIKYDYGSTQQEVSIYQVDNLNNFSLLNTYNTYISSITSDNKGNIYYSLPNLHQIIKLNVGIVKWGLSPIGQKTQDNTIQLDINGKKGTTSPVNENGKVN